MSIWKNCHVFLLHLLLLSVVTSKADILTLIDSSEPQPDLQATPCRLASFDQSALSSQKYVLIQEPATPSSVANFNDFIQSLAQYLAPFGYKVCTVAPGGVEPLTTSSSSIPEPIRIVTPAGTVGFTGSVSTTKLYHGRHNVQSLIGFIQQLEQHSGTISGDSTSTNVLPYQTIKTKMERKAFEHLKMPKIVAYFENETVPEFGTFVEAATELMADFPVYAVFDPVLAQKLRLKLPGQIALVRRLEKSTIYCPGTGVAVSGPTDGANVTANIGSVTAVTAADIVSWASGNRGLIHLLDDHNLYDPEVHDRSKYQLVVVGDRHTPIGMYLYKMVTKTIQNISRDNELKLLAISTQESPVSPDTPEEVPTTVTPPTETAAPSSPLPPIKLDDIEIVWIDLNKFPNIRSKLLSSVSNNLDVWFGLVQVPESKASQAVPESIPFTEIWFDIGSLNLTGTDKKADESNIQLLRTWILQVTDRPEPIPVPMITEPDPIRIEIPKTKPDQQDKEIEDILENQPESTIPEQKSKPDKSKDRKDTKKVPTNSGKTEL